MILISDVELERNNLLYSLEHLGGEDRADLLRMITIIYANVSATRINIDRHIYWNSQAEHRVTGMPLPPWNSMKLEHKHEYFHDLERIYLI